MDDFKKKFIIATVAILVLCGGFVYYHVQASRVDSVLTEQTSEIDNLQNRIAVLQAASKSEDVANGGDKVVGIDMDRVKTDTDAIQKTFDEVAAIDGTGTKRKDFVGAHGVNADDAFASTVIPDGKPSVLNGRTVMVKAYCCGISGSTYTYLVEVNGGDDYSLAAYVDTLSSKKDGTTVNNIRLITTNSSAYKW